MEEWAVCSHCGDGFGVWCEWFVEVVFDELCGEAEGSVAGVDDDSGDGAEFIVDSLCVLCFVFGVVASWPGLVSPGCVECWS